ncbi:hypothetical protein B0H10DRAFT_1968663 [Mycena sp. CBHHK59/15]|nr:hypothetical protein B0H10DRAFT_1968663 [Mycena sp. CBHHK59/15]
MEARSVNNIDMLLLDFHQRQRFNRGSALFEIRREHLKSMRNPSQEGDYFVLCNIGSGIGSEALLIPRATDLLEILRQRWGPDLKDVVRHLLAHGIPFWLAYVSAEIMPARETPVPLAHRPKGFKADTSSGLGFRAENYKFDVHDYNAYTTQRELRLLHTPRGRIALQYGDNSAAGKGRSLGRKLLPRVQDDIYNVGDCLWDGQSRFAYWHDVLSDRENRSSLRHLSRQDWPKAESGKGKGKGKQEQGLGESETDQTSIVSWWPKPSAWARGSLDGAWWTPQCEDNFFQKRLGHFEKEVFILARQSVWRHNLKFRKEVKKCWDGYEIVASSIVKAFVDLHIIPGSAS